MSAPQPSVAITPERLRALGRQLFVGAGSEEREAKLVADALVDASLSGHDSHGVVRFPQYLAALSRGEIRANRHARLTFESEALAIFDGDFGFGQVVGREAVEHGIGLARRSGAAVVGLGRSGHLGRIGDWAKMAADAGQISLHFVNVPGGLRVAPHGGREARFGTNPIAAGVPVPGGQPILLDISTASIPVGRVQLAKNRGERVPEGMILDRNGQSTREPDALFDGGSILPIAEHRGSGLSLIAELLAGAFTGGGASRAEQRFLYNNMLSVFVDTADQASGFAQEAKRYADWVRAAAPRDPGVPVLLPGDRSRHVRAERERGALRIDTPTWLQMREAALSFGLSPDAMIEPEAGSLDPAHR